MITEEQLIGLPKILQNYIKAINRKGKTYPDRCSELGIELKIYECPISQYVCGYPVILSVDGTLYDLESLIKMRESDPNHEWRHPITLEVYNIDHVCIALKICEAIESEIEKAEQKVSIDSDQIQQSQQELIELYKKIESAKLELIKIEDTTKEASRNYESVTKEIERKLSTLKLELEQAEAELSKLKNEKFKQSQQEFTVDNDKVYANVYDKVFEKYKLATLYFLNEYNVIKLDNKQEIIDFLTPYDKEPFLYPALLEELRRLARQLEGINLTDCIIKRLNFYFTWQAAKVIRKEIIPYIPITEKDLRCFAEFNEKQNINDILTSVPSIIKMYLSGCAITSDNGRLFLEFIKPYRSGLNPLYSSEAANTSSTYNASSSSNVGAGPSDQSSSTSVLHNKIWKDIKQMKYSIPKYSYPALELERSPLDLDGITFTRPDFTLPYLPTVSYLDLSVFRAPSENDRRILETDIQSYGLMKK